MIQIIAVGKDGVPEAYETLCLSLSHQLRFEEAQTEALRWQDRCGPNAHQMKLLLETAYMTDNPELLGRAAKTYKDLCVADEEGEIRGALLVDWAVAAALATEKGCFEEIGLAYLDELEQTSAGTATLLGVERYGRLMRK